METINTMKNAVIIGAGTQGQIYASYLKEAGVNIIGFIDDNPNLTGKQVINIPVIGKYKDLFLQEFKEKIQDVYCPIGINAVRIEYLSTLKKEGYGIPSFFHHTVSIGPDVILGEAVYMLAGNSVMPHTTIGSYIMINSSSTIAHHVTLEDGVFMSSGVNIGALMRIKKNAYVGMGVTVMTGVKTVGKETLIGAGTVVIKDIPDYAVVVGNPGRVLRTKKPQDTFSFDNNEISDIVFVGSGISSSFTLMHLLENLNETNSTKKISIRVVDKFKEFHTGIPYGTRSGSSVHLITSLENFLPQPEFDKFVHWLNDNKNWLLSEYLEDGGKLAEKWIAKHKQEIENNNWNALFLPRRFFGYYLTEKIEKKIAELKAKNRLDINYIQAEIVDVHKLKKCFNIETKGGSIIKGAKVVVSVGSLPVNDLWKNKPLIQDTNLLFVNNPYLPSLNEILYIIKDFVKERASKKTNILIVGANASALEMLYKLNDIASLDNANFVFLSTLGLMPDGIVDEIKLKKYAPKNLELLANQDTLTACQIANATYKDLDAADEIKLGPASTVGVISKAFGSLLSKLNESELEKFACIDGNEIGRRQRCAGIHYLNVAEELKKENRFQHIAGRFSSFNKTSNDEYKLEYLDTETKEKKVYQEPFHVVVNCVGSMNLESEHLPILFKNLIGKKMCNQNSSKIGFRVNENLEASENLHIIGPLLAGNVIDNNAVWHVEHCGRILKYSKILASKLNPVLV